MNRSDYTEQGLLEMPAGEELDRIVGDWMGGRVGEAVPNGHRIPKTCWVFASGGYLYHKPRPGKPPEYSKRWRWAGNVLDKLVGLGAASVGWDPSKERYLCRVVAGWHEKNRRYEDRFDPYKGDDWYDAMVYGESAFVAICRAAALMWKREVEAPR